MAIPKGKQRVMITLEDDIVKRLDEAVKITKQTRSDVVHDGLMIVFAVMEGVMAVVEVKGKEEEKHEVN